MSVGLSFAIMIIKCGAGFEGDLSCGFVVIIIKMHLLGSCRCLILNLTKEVLLWNEVYFHFIQDFVIVKQDSTLLTRLAFSRQELQDEKWMHSCWGGWYDRKQSLQESFYLKVTLYHNTVVLVYDKDVVIICILGGIGLIRNANFVITAKTNTSLT